VIRRRILQIAAVAVGLAASAGTLAACGSDGDGGSGTSAGRVDAIFADASFAGPGQDVRIAGANVGRIVDVSVTADRRARVAMEVEERFLPFRTDATCTVLPQSLIGERFVDCTPGTPDEPTLEPRDGLPATVPIDNTTSPVDLDLVVAMLGEPQNVRLQLLLNEIGAGGAARGPEISRAIRRANPALQEIRTTLDTLERDRDALARAVEASGDVLAALDTGRRDLAGFVTETGRFLGTTAAASGDVDRTLQRLPGALRRLRPALQELRSLGRDATPAVRDLRRASPDLTELMRASGPLSDAARPTLVRLARAARVIPPKLRRSRPRVTALGGALRSLTPSVAPARRITGSLVQNAAPENLATFLYHATLATSRYDGTSHYVPANLVITPCLLRSTTPVEGCEGRFVDEAAGRTRDRGPDRERALTRRAIQQGLPELAGGTR